MILGFIPLHESKAKAQEVPHHSTRFHKGVENPQGHHHHMHNMYYHPFHQVYSPKSVEETLVKNDHIDDLSLTLGRQLSSREKKHTKIETMGSRHRFDGPSNKA